MIADNEGVKNYSVSGSAIYSKTGLTYIDNCLISSNGSIVTRALGIYAIDIGGQGYANSNTLLHLTNTTVTNNTNGVSAYSTSTTPVKIIITNNTIFNNIGNPTYDGRGVFLDRSSAIVTNNTITNNKTGIRSYYSNKAYLKNNLVVNNSGFDIEINDGVSDNGLVDSGYNFVGNTDNFSRFAATGTVTGTTATSTINLSSSLQANPNGPGGVLTLSAGSNAIDAGHNGLHGPSGNQFYPPCSDQTSKFTNGTRRDVGAYEYTGLTSNPAASVSIGTQPSLTNVNYETGNTVTALSIAATGSILQYQWYSNVVSNTTGAIKIAGATNTSYTPSNSIISNAFYYVIVSEQGANCDYKASDFSGRIIVAVPLNPEINTFTSSKTNLKALDVASLAISLTQSSTTFLLSDISLESSGIDTGALSAFTAVNSQTYTLSYTPPVNFSGTISLTITPGAFDNTDSPAKANTLTSTLALFIDTIAPTISTLSHTHSDAIVRDADTVPFIVTFTEPMASSPKISIGSLVTNASMTVSPSTSSQTWTYNWNVPAGNDGLVSATVSATDLFGNYYTGSDALSITIDNVSPTITLTENDADNILLFGESVIFTASVDEIITGVSTMTIQTLTSTTSYNMTASGSNWTYTYSAPTSYSGSVTYTVSMLDVAGNTATASTTLLVDTIVPEITLITSPNANGKYTDNDIAPANSDTISITLTFSENVVVSSSGGIPILQLNTLPDQFAFYNQGSGTQTLTFVYKVLDGDEVTDLDVLSLQLNGETIKDVNGNPVNLDLTTLIAATNNLSHKKDLEIRAKDPIFSVLTAASNNSAFAGMGATDGNVVTYSFVTDQVLLSGSISTTFSTFTPSLTNSLSSATHSFSFTVSNTMPEGPINFILNATDTDSSTFVTTENRSANYAQSAFNQLIIIDRTAPLITSSATFNVAENSVVGPRVTSNETPVIFALNAGVDQAKFTINPSTGVLSFVNAPDFEIPTDTGTDNVYDIQVLVTDIVGLTATQSIAITITDVSDTFGVNVTAIDAQTNESGDTATVALVLFTQPTADVIIQLSSSDISEGTLSIRELVFTPTSWNISQQLVITGVDDGLIDGDISYQLLIDAVISTDINYNGLSVGAASLVNIDDEIDQDGDGFFDYQDAFPLDPTEWFDTDSDGLGNNTDTDDDNDGFLDALELECGSNSLDVLDIPLDSDNDGILDCRDTDDDNDGVLDTIDNCPFVANALQADTDLDGFGDLCDSDDDNDGFDDDTDAFPLDATEWLDTDSDGIGNKADLDDDNDGQLDIDEIACGSSPLDSNSLSLDTDADNIPDCVDTDDDNDGEADLADAFPLDASEWSDTDKDGIGNNADLDDDGDGFSDLDELSCGSDPLNPLSKPADQDGDGIADCIDVDRDGDGVLNTQDVFPDDTSESEDTDGDGLGNNLDVDDDNDGILDVSDVFPLDPTEWSDADGDGIGDNADTDDNNDGFTDQQLFISGMLSPTSGGLESTWKIINIDKYPNARVTVYNKIGQEVFNKSGYKNNWGGTYKKTSNILPSGSYFYKIDLNDGSKGLSGWLYITY